MQRCGPAGGRAADLPSDVIAFVVFWRPHFRPTLRDPSEIMALHGIEVSHEGIRDRETKLVLVLREEFRECPSVRRRELPVSRDVDETCPKVRGRWPWRRRSTGTASWSTPCSASTAAPLAGDPRQSFNRVDPARQPARPAGAARQRGADRTPGRSCTATPLGEFRTRPVDRIMAARLSKNHSSIRLPAGCGSKGRDRLHI